MAPRANWKGFLRLSLVTCPVALYPATSESEKISFNQLNKQTGHRIKYLKVDADTGEEVPNEDIVKGYMLDKETFIEVSKEELEEIALESTRTIEIDEFVEKSEIDHRVAGGGRPPPAPTERGVRISRTTLFGSWFTAFTAICSSFVSMVG
jgi:DNA end-binding protein Ku